MEIVEVKYLDALASVGVEEESGFVGAHDVLVVFKERAGIG